MKNNFCEEQSRPNKITAFHDEQVKKLHLPDWVIKNCIYCKKELRPSAIREISMRLNARNIYDICVEFFCEECSLMNKVYYRKEFLTIEEFCEFLLNKRQTTSDPVEEEAMYRMNYNNLMEIMVRKGS
jgi:hypothetical protein